MDARAIKRGIMNYEPIDGTIEYENDKRAYGIDIPTPESDAMPEFTKFVLKIGEVYENTYLTNPAPNGSKQERARQKKVTEFLEEYFCTKFKNILYKEFKIK